VVKRLSAAPGAESSATRRQGSEQELRGWLELAIACADEADRMALATFRRDVRVETKPDRSLVTETDRAIEERIRAVIRQRHPDHGLIGEEYGEDSPGASVRWYIDPIDGTHNFVRGIPLFGLLLGVERDGEMQVGLMSAPALHERWFAWRGGGAWASGSAGMAAGDTRRLAVSGVSSIEDSQVLYGSLGDIEESGLGPGLPRLIRSAWRDRGFGDFWGYALVAEGAAEAMIEVDVHSWDLAAPQVIVEEAGGRLTDLRGQRTIEGRSVLASNGLLHQEILAILQDT
jgi:histidinol-phosphatase